MREKTMVSSRKKRSKDARAHDENSPSPTKTPGAGASDAEVKDASNAKSGRKRKRDRRDGDGVSDTPRQQEGTEPAPAAEPDPVEAQRLAELLFELLSARCEEEDRLSRLGDALRVDDEAMINLTVKRLPEGSVAALLTALTALLSRKVDPSL
jgi:hypothetical protein